MYYYLSEAFFFLMRDSRRVDPGGRWGAEGLGGVKGGGNVIRLYYVREEYISIEEKINRQAIEYKKILRVTYLIVGMSMT